MDGRSNCNEGGRCQQYARSHQSRRSTHISIYRAHSTTPICLLALRQSVSAPGCTAERRELLCHLCGEISPRQRERLLPPGDHRKHDADLVLHPHRAATRLHWLHTELCLPNDGAAICPDLIRHQLHIHRESQRPRDTVQGKILSLIHISEPTRLL